MFRNNAIPKHGNLYKVKEFLSSLFVCVLFCIFFYSFSSFVYSFIKLKLKKRIVTEFIEETTVVATGWLLFKKLFKKRSNKK